MTTQELTLEPKREFKKHTRKIVLLVVCCAILLVGFFTFKLELEHLFTRINHRDTLSISYTKAKDKPLYTFSGTVTETSCHSRPGVLNCSGPKPFYKTPWEEKTKLGFTKAFKVMEIDTEGRSKLVKTFSTTTEGKFSVDLPPGRYSLLSYFENQYFQHEECISAQKKNTCLINISDSDVHVKINFHSGSTGDVFPNLMPSPVSPTSSPLL